MFYFNESVAADATFSPVPFVALISCDSNETAVVDTKSTIGVNGMNLTTIFNSTSGGTGLNNGTGIASNGTVNGTSTAGNGTTASTTGVNITSETVFTLARNLNATSAVLYSRQGKVSGFSCFTIERETFD